MLPNTPLTILSVTEPLLLSAKPPPLFNPPFNPPLHSIDPLN